MKLIHHNAINEYSKQIKQNKMEGFDSQDIDLN